MKRFDALYKQHYKLIFRLAFRFVKDYESAADISQDVFVYLYKRLKANAKIENERAWLYKVTSNLSLAHLKKTKRIVEFKKEAQNKQKRKISQIQKFY